MKTFQYIVKDELGIHARPAGMLAKEVAKYQSVIYLTANGKSIDASRIIMIISLGVKQGTQITISAEGEDEAQAIAGMESFRESNL